MIFASFFCIFVAKKTILCITQLFIIMADLEELIKKAPYSTDPNEQRAIIIATFLKYIKQNDKFKFRSVLYKDSEGETYMFYATDFNFERYLWVDMYEDGERWHSSLEDCTLDEVLYASDDSPHCSFSAFQAIDKRGDFIEVDPEKYLCI